MSRKKQKPVIKPIEPKADEPRVPLAEIDCLKEGRGYLAKAIYVLTTTPGKKYSALRGCMLALRREISWLDKRIGLLERVNAKAASEF